ncbi:DUF4150 domain-containing protein [Chitinimonas arctica]|uniref:DUF4150 domain-containing protein n=1 Tax=Chitinimonas arctica TaxID=2594795 RepID=A0A516SK21_9NEIS|nr:DUF4150 domain-containing protein [Chitinimonas arctica]QDQ28507.1 DUF4150 domain-containing protein [Chitinimonas arctica]
MFANTNLGVLNLGFPDVCLTPPLAVPVPYPNLTFSVTHVPSQFNILIGGGLAENLLTQGTVSLGDLAGVLTGVASGTVAGPDRPVLGSIKVLFGAAFATRLTTLTIQNSTNTVGVSLTPAQICVLLLS